MCAQPERANPFTAMPSSSSYRHLSNNSNDSSQFPPDIPLLPNRRTSIEDTSDRTYTGYRYAEERRSKSSSFLQVFAKRQQYTGESSPDFKINFSHEEPTPSELHEYAPPNPSRDPLQSSFTHRRHPLSDSFEAPIWPKVLTLVFVTVISYPVLLIFIIVARGKSLFWARLFIGVGCGLVGFCLGLCLVTLAKSFLEAATWATLIHQSRVVHAPGIKLKDLAAWSHDSTSAWTGLKLLWNRHTYTGAARKNRISYDSRPWSLVIVFFLFVVLVAASLPFVLGRLVDIQTKIQHQYETYEEVTVKGDISDLDIEQAKALLLSAFDNYALTWTLAPYSTHGGLPPAISFNYLNDTVYFSETTASQLQTHGSGFGTFSVNTTAASRDVQDQVTSGSIVTSVSPGQVLRYPRWGLRIRCKKIPDLTTNIVPKSANALTYLYIPRSVVQDLFQEFEMDFPEILNARLNTSKILQFNDTLPVGVDPDNYVTGASFSDNGVAHSFFSSPLSMGESGTGWQTLETVLVRLNTSYTPAADWTRKSDVSVLDANGKETWIGYDAAVCLELYDPWVTDTYNTTSGKPTTVNIISQSEAIVNSGPKDNIKGNRLQGPNLSRELNSTRLVPVYSVAHQNSVNQVLKDNGRDSFYVPSPTVVSFTSGLGPLGYTELSEVYFAQARALADASNLLPYLAGTGDTVARCYADLQLATVELKPGYMFSFLGIVLALGLVAGCFVPKLPLALPKRGFELYSWLAAFSGNELVETVDGTHSDALPKQMPLHELEATMGERTYRYVF